MGDGWTGIDLDAVKSQLDAFKDEMDNFSTNYITAFNLFNEELYRTWASDKALEFNSHLKILAALNTHIKQVEWNILYSASKAADFMAQHNGASFTYDVGEKPTAVDEPKTLEESKDGIKGMNVILAKMSVDAFKESVTQIVTSISTISTDFSLLDPEGALKTQYRNMVNTLIVMISNDVTSAIKSVTSAFETEELNVMLGKQQAQSALA